MKKHKDCFSKNNCWSMMSFFEFKKTPQQNTTTLELCFKLLPCPYTGPKMFCAGPNFLSQPKYLTAFSATSKTFVPAQKPILLNANHLFVWHKMFVTDTISKKIFGFAQKVWTSPKHFGTCKRTRHKRVRYLTNNR